MHHFKQFGLYVLVIGFISLYMYGSFLTFREDRLVQGIQELQVTNDFVADRIEDTHFYNPVFFRKAAEKLQFVPHDPDTVRNAFHSAIVKAPGDYMNFFSYARYAASSPCCREQAPKLFREAVRRKSYDLRIYQDAGAALLSTGHEKEAFAHFAHVLMHSSSMSGDIYRIIERHGGSLEDMIRITPRQSESLISLCSFLSSRRKMSDDELQRVLRELEKIPMKPDHMIMAAKSALHGGDLQWARMQATKALEHPSVQIDALLILANVLEKEQKWEEFEALAERIEKHYREKGTKQEAAGFVFETVMKLSSIEDDELTIERLKRLVDHYPGFAPAYFRLGQFNEKQPEVSLRYFREAAELEPRNPEYSATLADQYLQLFRIIEAERIYRRLLEIPEFKTIAYVGLAACRSQSGKPDQAIPILQEGIKQNKNSLILWRELAKSYDAVQDYNNAAEAYKKITEMTPRAPQSYLMVAEMYQKAGEFTAAKKQYERVLDFDPKNKAALEGLLSLQTTQQ